MNQTMTTLGTTETVSPTLRRSVRYTSSDDAVLTLTDAAEILPGCAPGYFSEQDEETDE
jgi:hypothetical protein